MSRLKVVGPLETIKALMAWMNGVKGLVMPHLLIAQLLIAFAKT